MFEFTVPVQLPVIVRLIIELPLKAKFEFPNKEAPDSIVRSLHAAAPETEGILETVPGMVTFVGIPGTTAVFQFDG